MPTIVPDQYDVLFCKCDGVAQAFEDALDPPKKKTITANGNATQLSLPTGVTSRTAGFFTSTTNYVQVADSTSWDFGTDDYKIEFLTNIGTAEPINFVVWNTDNFMVRFSGSALLVYQAGNPRINYSWSPTLNTVWYKIKAERVSGVTTLYINDVSVGTYSGSDNIDTGTTGLSVGLGTNAGSIFWMKNLTITKASTLVLDMRFDSPATSPLGPAIAFDGTGDYLTVADHADFDMTDWTVEGFFKFDKTTAEWSINRLWSIGAYNSGGMAFINSSGAMDLYINNTAHNFGSYTHVANKWYHLRWVKSGSTIRMFIDGKQHGADKTQTYTLNPATGVVIGTWNGETSNFWGSLREFRISNSVRDSANDFTPSQTGFTVDPQTVLYIKGSENNGVTTFVDSSTSPKTVTTAGDTKIKYTEDYRSCIFKDETGKFPYPVGSAKVDFFTVSGSGVYRGGADGDYLSIADSDDWDFPDAFTWETYARFASVGTMFFMHGFNEQWAFSYHGGTLRCGIEAVSTVTASWTPLANTWYHLTASREADGTVRLFANGSLLGSASSATAISGTASLNIGAYDASNYSFLGLLDNIRISKGVARYTAAFNPPDDTPTPVSNNKSQFFALL